MTEASGILIYTDIGADWLAIKSTVICRFGAPGSCQGRFALYSATGLDFEPYIFV